MSDDTNKVRWTITIDPDLAKRLDHVALLRDENRSQMIERILRNSIENEEEFIEAMESPVQRAIIQAMVNTPGLVASMAALLGEHVDVDAIRQRLPEHVRRGKEREAARKGSRRAKEALA